MSKLIPVFTLVLLGVYVVAANVLAYGKITGLIDVGWLVVGLVILGSIPVTLLVSEVMKRMGGDER